MCINRIDSDVCMYYRINVCRVWNIRYKCVKHSLTNGIMLTRVLKLVH